MQILKYAVQNVAHGYGKTATFMPKPIVGDNGSGMHVHQSLQKDGKNLFAGDSYGGPVGHSRCTTSAASSSTRKALNAITNPGTNSYKRLVPGFEAPVMLAYSARNRSASIRIPYVSNPKARRIEVRFPDSERQPVPRLRRDADGRPRRRPEQDPSRAIRPTRTCTTCAPEEAKHIPTVCHSLDKALEHLDKDREFLTARRRVHRRHDRRLHRAEDAGSDALPHDHASGRVRHVLQLLAHERTRCPSRPQRRLLRGSGGARGKGCGWRRLRKAATRFCGACARGAMLGPDAPTAVYLIVARLPGWRSRPPCTSGSTRTAWCTTRDQPHPNAEKVHVKEPQTYSRAESARGRRCTEPGRRRCWRPDLPRLLHRAAGRTTRTSPTSTRWRWRCAPIRRCDPATRCS